MAAAMIGGVTIATLAERYGTPAYVYDADRVLRRVAAIQSALAGIDHRIYYSGKANALPLNDRTRKIHLHSSLISTLTFEIAKISKERDAYIKTETEKLVKTGDSFDGKVAATVKEAVAPLPWRLITSPLKLWIRSLLPSIIL